MRTHTHTHNLLITGLRVLVIVHSRLVSNIMCNISHHGISAEYRQRPFGPQSWDRQISSAAKDFNSSRPVQRTKVLLSGFSGGGPGVVVGGSVKHPRAKTEAGCFNNCYVGTQNECDSSQHLSSTVRRAAGRTLSEFERRRDNKLSTPPETRLQLYLHSQ
jgi:hypothetical protein